VLDKVARYHEAFGHRVINVAGNKGGLGQEEWEDSLRLFVSDVVPELRRTIPDPPSPEQSADVADRPAVVAA